MEGAFPTWWVRLILVFRDEWTMQEYDEGVVLYTSDSMSAEKPLSYK